MIPKSGAVARALEESARRTQRLRELLRVALRSEYDEAVLDGMRRPAPPPAPRPVRRPKRRQKTATPTAPAKSELDNYPKEVIEDFLRLRGGAVLSSEMKDIGAAVVSGLVEVKATRLGSMAEMTPLGRRILALVPKDGPFHFPAATGMDYLNTKPQPLKCETRPAPA